MEICLQKAKKIQSRKVGMLLVSTSYLNIEYRKVNVFLQIDSDNNFGGLVPFGWYLYILVEYAGVISEPIFCEIVCDNIVCAGVLVNDVGRRNL